MGSDPDWGTMIIGRVRSPTGTVFSPPNITLSGILKLFGIRPGERIQL